MKWLSGIAALCLSLSAAQAEGPGADSIYYRVRTELVGYPPYRLAAGERSPLTSIRDLRQAWRIIAYAYDDLTPAQARAKAREFKDKGFNLVLSEGNRYLFRGDKPLKSGAAMRVAKYEDVIRNTRIMSDACHEVGLKFFLHLTCTMVDAGLLEDHPEWAAIDIATGKTITNGYGTANSCINNDEFMAAFYRRLDRLIRETKVDGIMQDEIQFFSPTLCGCRWCREKSKKETGFEIPATPDGWLYRFTDNPCYARWLEWRREKVVENLQKVRRMIRKYNPDNTVITYLCNNTVSYAYYSAGLCIDDFPKYADSVGLECEPHDMLFQYYWPLVIYEMKYLRAVAENIGTAPWTLFYSRTLGDHTWNWFLAMSQGSRVWWFDSDPAAEGSWTPVLAWEEKHERILMDVTSAANIGVLFSLDTRDRNVKRWNGRDWIRGFAGTCNALTDGHVPYRVLVDGDMTAAALKKKVKTLILFDTGSLSDSAVAAVRMFVKDGGILLASGDTSLFTEKGQLRADFGLADVLGFSVAGERSGRNTLEIPAANEVTGTLTGSFKHEYPFYRLKNVAPDVKVIGWMKPDEGEREPGILTRGYGKGKVVYFAGHPAFHYFFHYYNENVIKPGAEWKDFRDARIGRLLCHAARFGNDELPMVTENLPAGIVAEVYRHATRDLKGIEVHLANFLGGRVTEGRIPPFDDVHFPEVKPNLPDPAKSITVSVRAQGVTRVFLLSPDFDATVELPHTVKGGYCTVAVPTLYRYAILYFSQGNDRDILNLNGGKVTRTLPAAKTLITNIRAPLVGKYDPRAAVVFADAKEFKGGLDFGWYKKEPAHFLYGTMSNVTTATVTVRVKETMADPVLDIGGMDDNQPYSKAPLEIRFNGKVIFSGKSTYPDQEWAVRTFALDPVDVRVGENIVEIKNTGHGPQGNIPWFGVSFVRIRPK